MGLILAKTLPSGIRLDSSYARISSIGGTKNNISLTLTYYADKNNFIATKEPVLHEGYTFSPDVGDTGENFIRQGYLYLMSLPEFNQAVEEPEVLI